MRPKGSADRLEYRRQWAAQLLDAGKGVNEVARLVQVSPSSVSRWKSMKAQAGEAGLKAKPHPGRGCQLSPQDKGAPVHGIITCLLIRHGEQGTP